MKKINSFEEYQSEYKKSVENPEDFWAEQAATQVWKKQWDTVLNWNFKDPDVKWFEGGQLNITENCLDRHLETKGDQVAIIWEPNDPKDEAQKITYKELHNRVCTFANVLKKRGIQKGDRVCLYMPMIPELAIAVLACARIGAIHSVVFAGFSAKSLSDRINDSDCKIVLTADGAYRGAKTIDLKSIVDEALKTCTTVENVIVYNRLNSGIHLDDSKEHWWHEEIASVDADCPAETMESEDTLFILYTSGSTGKPKGVVHTCGGYQVYAEYSFRNVFQYEEGDIYWCTADIGWITGHSYIVYGPLLAGATTVMFEGVPTWPDAGRFWEVVDKYKINIFYTAPTAIRALQAYDLDFVNKHDLSSLKTLGSVGEPINEEAWEWYHEHVGKKKCAIVDTWWQTETGGILISPLAHLTKEKPSYATYPLPGIQPQLVDAEGNELEGNEVSGNLCVKFPWPSMIRTTWGDHERCQNVYFSTYKDRYFTGDGCLRDENGMYRITGRVDDVINVSGHRMGTAEVENAINEHGKVIESAVVGYPHDIKGQGIYAYVIVNEEALSQDDLKKEILATVTDQIGPIAKPDKIQVVPGLPKTRSGKIMRRILRKIAEGDTSNLGDTSTLLDPTVVESIKSGAL
ncbi:MAG: acetate--CoA ligase [Flavobacteriales bacterium]|nr:acetate--CoA ligase [Flavobacteriales bacterium]